MEWIIYKHTNNINGKIYIGQTKQSPIVRWQSGLGYAPHNNDKDCVFWNAIKKYGWNSFSHDIIENGIKTQEEANEREMYWIDYYRSYIGFDNANGYNMTLGGNNCSHLGYDVYQINKTTLEVINEFSSTAEASRYFGSDGNASQIRRCCDGTMYSAKGFYWCYKRNYSSNWSPRSNQLLSPIYQIDDNFEVIHRYNSITECVKETGFSSGSIVSCCRRKQRKANNYFWCYESEYEENWKPAEVTFYRNEKIYCFETNKVYKNAKEASILTGANKGHILRCCKRKENGTNGLHFCYVKDVDNYIVADTQKRGAIYTNEENEILREYYPSMGLSKELLALLPNRTAGSIRQQAHRLRLIANDPYKNSRKKVLCVELNIVFESIEDAYKFVKMKDGSGIGRVCNGKRETAGGYHWKYVD